MCLNFCLRCLNLSGRSFPKKPKKAFGYIDLYKSDIVLITETMPKNSDDKYDNVFNMPGFNCIENNHGRGVCIFYKEKLDLSIHSKINDMFQPSIFVNIRNQSNPVNIGLVYRSPNCYSKDNSKLNKQLNFFASKKLKNLVIFGDFNHPSIDWNFISCNKNEDHPDSLFLFEFLKIKTNQLICQTTHHKPNCKPSLIDLVLTKTPDIILNIEHNPPIGRSHHDVITTIIKTDADCKAGNKCKKEKIVKPNFDKANFKEINDFFNNVNWETNLRDMKVEDAWQFIKDKIQTAQNKFVPKRYINHNKVIPNPLPKDDTLHSL